jgi:hypothetical protein
MPSTGKPKPPDFLREHIESRKSWGRYVTMAASIRRSASSEVDAFLKDLRPRLRQRSGPHT